MQEKPISSKVIFSGKVVRLRIDTVLTPDGRETSREIVEHSECVAMIPVDKDGNILLVRQFRGAIGKELLEIPAGGIEPGENPDEAVLRELREETGYTAKKIKKLGGFYTSPGFCNEYIHLYLATDLAASPLVAEDTAEITVVKTPPSKIPSLIKSGKIQDFKSVAGLMLYLRK